MIVTKLAVAAALIVASVPSGQAQSLRGITCDDVRALSPAEREYWSGRLNLSAAQRHRIEVACLQGEDRHRIHTVREKVADN